MQGQLIFFSQLHYNLSMKEEYLINQQPLTLKKKFHNKTQVNQSTLISIASILK